MEKSTFLLNGEWRSSDRSRSIINPYSSRVVGEVYLASPEDIEAAIAGAVEAFQHTRKLASFERAAILHQIADTIEASAGDFAGTITLETGKPISFSRAEVERSVLTFRVAASEAERIEGSVLPLDLASHSRGRVGLARRFPIGPIGAITPFNFPLNLVAHKVAPAIAAGNPVVLKPASAGILTALKLGEVLDKTVLPKGAFSIVPCSGGEIEQLVIDQRIKLLSFTGSPDVGWGIKSRAGKKKVTLELGGNAAVIVDRGVPIQSTAKRIALGAFGNAGQSCIAVQRIYVHNSEYEVFEREFLTCTGSLKVGDPSDDATVVGPMIDEGAAVNIEQWIKDAVASGARILCGGGRKGAVLEPTVLVNVRPDMKVSCAEVFAPVATLEPFSDFQEAIAKANHSAFGLQAGIFTNDYHNAFYAYEKLEVGGVIINDYPTYRIDHMPYGGVKDSGFGREGVRYAMESMTELKLMALNFTN